MNLFMFWVKFLGETFQQRINSGSALVFALFRMLAVHNALCLYVFMFVPLFLYVWLFYREFSFPENWCDSVFKTSPASRIWDVWDMHLNHLPLEGRQKLIGLGVRLERSSQEKQSALFPAVWLGPFHSWCPVINHQPLRMTSLHGKKTSRKRI